MERMMKSLGMRRVLVVLVVMAMALPMLWPLASAPAQEATTQPATRPTAEVAPEAKPLLDQVVKAYSDLKSLRLAGTINGTFDVQQEQEKQSAPFTATYSAPGLFRHAVEGAVTAGSTGEKAYVHVSQGNVYMNAPAPKQKVKTDDLPEPLGAVLNGENPSLLLAVAADPRFELMDDVQRITLGPPAQVEGKELPVLRLEAANGRTLDLRIDPQTHLVRQAYVNLKPMLEERGAVEVKQAEMLIDYTAIEPGAELSQETFAWAPPPGAKDLADVRREQMQKFEQMMAEIEQMKGKPAPDITLTTPEGKLLKLSELKGSPVLLDFWATWCAPCIALMPHVEAIHRDKGTRGLKVFIVNVGEEKADVDAFVAEQGWQVPQLFDPDGSARLAFDSVASLPFQVLIDKDGVIRGVSKGLNEQMQANMDKAIDEVVK
jgi:thiol-disulfide isomerase/thioredoxin/outer membrane lipoprotein-sorting protein